MLPIVEPDRFVPTTAKLAGPCKGKYAVISLGCPKNLVDTEQMLGRLNQDGYEMVQDPDGADFVVVNTCGFIESARAESMEAIDEMLRLKADGKIRGVIVTGCLPERKGVDLKAMRPEIDALVGVFGRDEIVSVADSFTSSLEEQRTVFRPAPVRALADNHRQAVTPKHFAYLKISEGCDRLCTFCAIPKMRGKHASKPIEQVLDEAKQLADSGVREINIVAQDTTYYGLDIYGKPRLTDLLDKLDQIDGIEWIRLMYFYPMYIDADLAQRIGTAKRILPYIDMPLQHASDTMLRRMSRRVDRKGTEETIGLLREYIPNLVMRTTFITGFPGETEQDFQQLLDFVRQQKFERLGVFTYSLEPDTPAAKLPDHLPENVKNKRRDRLMQVQQKIAYRWSEARVGTKVDVLIDQQVAGQDNVWIGRTAADAPDIDPLVFVTGIEGFDVAPGKFVPCEIVASQGYDLAAVPVGNSR
jgi:ribosomal protein S12 methylthiotransferase